MLEGSHRKSDILRISRYCSRLHGQGPSSELVQRSFRSHQAHLLVCMRHTSFCFLQGRTWAEGASTEGLKSNSHSTSNSNGHSAEREP
mmetsp:Transcript_3060/g.7382  ORF Transcript_3060/g.7382 Transcript_3060/m.7382 type:complete len:88 (-) Transcript_3060:112-375(-)|eukprot:CAMPEP_0115313882 /NCGR_PEP_ID=MMETSP0270-20121206/76718_1 /TAXON_ID=71861 /ORGANISM="Scrippsiella trochoidea, Strain CCMP3099" /LENGTH=87 /DNA_ID=CAMNT_0002733035 /DNA_START=21 /DNA_END=284 /DNA_ORIENTATION=+